MHHCCTNWMGAFKRTVRWIMSFSHPHNAVWLFSSMEHKRRALEEHWKPQQIVNSIYTNITILKTVWYYALCCIIRYIPQQCEDIVSAAKFILIVEKDATFQRLLDDDFCTRLSSCVIITVSIFLRSVLLCVFKAWMFVLVCPLG